MLFDAPFLGAGRGAILRLIQDEALVQKSAREVRVPIITRNSPDPAELEGLAAPEAALKASARDVEHLRGLIALNQTAIADKNWMEALSLNQTFDAAERAIVADITEGGKVILERLISRHDAKAGAA